MLVWACIDGGVVVDIDEVDALPKAERPRPWCPDCEGSLTPVLGEVMAHHFRHPEGSKCEAAAGGEGAMHTNAKLLLQRLLTVGAVAEHALSATVPCPQCETWWREGQGDGWRPFELKLPHHAGREVNRVQVPVLPLTAGDVVGIRPSHPDLKVVRSGHVQAVIEVFVKRSTPEDRWAKLLGDGILVLEVCALDVLGEEEGQDWSLAQPLPLHRWGGAASRCPKCEAWWKGPSTELLVESDVDLYLQGGEHRRSELVLRRVWAEGRYSAELRIGRLLPDDQELLQRWDHEDAAQREHLVDLARATTATWVREVSQARGARPVLTLKGTPETERRRFAWAVGRWVEVLVPEAAWERWRIQQVLRKKVKEVVDEKTGEVFYDLRDYRALCHQLATEERSRLRRQSYRRRWHR